MNNNYKMHDVKLPIWILCLIAVVACDCTEDEFAPWEQPNVNIVDGAIVDLDGNPVEDGSTFDRDGNVIPPDSGTNNPDGDMNPDGDVNNPDGDVNNPDGTVMPPDANVAPLCTDRECCDGIDNDGDGQIDGNDLECTRPDDNDEGSFQTGIPGDNVDPKWQDCFFDGNSGAGDDGCRYRTECITGELPQTDQDCQLSQQCLDFCAPRAPNGCDCFGCCEIATDNGSLLIYTGSPECSDEVLNDTEKCPRCVQSTQCGNPCGRCEICPGKTVADLPADCFPPPPVPDASVPNPDGGTNNPDAGSPPDAMVPPPTPTCEGGKPCSGQGDCTEFEYCQQGCCLPGLI